MASRRWKGVVVVEVEGEGEGEVEVSIVDSLVFVGVRGVEM